MAERFPVVCDKCKDPQGCNFYKDIQNLERHEVEESQINAFIMNAPQMCALCPILDARRQLIRKFKGRKKVFGEDTVDLPGSK